MLTHLELNGAKHAGRSYYVHAHGGVIFSVVFCPSVGHELIPVGTTVTIKYDKIVNGVVQSCSTPMTPTAEELQQLQEPQPLLGERRRRRVLLGAKFTTPTAPRLLVYVPTFCGFNASAALTLQQVFNILVVGNGTSKSRSLAGYYKTCSYGDVSLLPENVKVLGPVDVPCNGSLRSPHPFASGPNFTTRACDESENLYKWHYWLDEWAQQNHNVSSKDFHHRIIILPRQFTAKVKGCNGVAGAAVPGRWPTERTKVNDWGSSLIWWSGDMTYSLEILFHEIGHTYGMGHATIPNGCDLKDQCDHTCTMGATGGQGIRCFNAPHNWQS